MSPRAVVCALAVLAIVVAVRRARWRGVASVVCSLATIDLARLVTYPRAAQHVQPWWSLDAALVLTWACVLAVGVERRWAWSFALVPVYALVRPALPDSIVWDVLRWSRLALTLPFTIGVWRPWGRVRAEQAAPLVLVAGAIAGTWGAWESRTWWISWPVSYGAYAIVAVMMVWDMVREEER